MLLDQLYDAGLHNALWRRHLGDFVGDMETALKDDCLGSSGVGAAQGRNGPSGRRRVRMATEYDDGNNDYHAQGLVRSAHQERAMAARNKVLIAGIHPPVVRRITDISHYPRKEKKDEKKDESKDWPAGFPSHSCSAFPAPRGRLSRQSQWQRRKKCKMRRLELEKKKNEDALKREEASEVQSELFDFECHLARMPASLTKI